MQTTLLGLAIAFILALVAALIGPFFIDWNQFRPQFEAEASRVVGMPVRVSGTFEARLLPAPSLRLRSIVVGGARDAGKIRAEKLDVEFSLSALMRGEWRATELTVNGAAIDLGLDAEGQVDLPTSTGPFNLGALSIDRLNLTGRMALHDTASHSTLQLNDIAFSGDVRSLAAGAMRGDGNATLSGTRYPFRLSSGQTGDGSGTRVRLTIDPAQRPLSIDLDGILSFDGRVPHFDGAMVLASPLGLKIKGPDDRLPTPWRISSKLKADPTSALLEGVEASYGSEDIALKLAGVADIRFGASPLWHAVLSAKPFDADRLLAKESGSNEPTRLLPALRKLLAAIPPTPLATQIEISAEQIMLGGRPLQNIGADLRGNAAAWNVDELELRAPGNTRVVLSGAVAQPGAAGTFKGTMGIDSSDPDTLAAWLQGRSEVTYRNQKPLRLRGTLTTSPDNMVVEALKAEVDGGTLEGRVAFWGAAADGGSRFDADLKADRLDLDAAATLIRSFGGPQAEWPAAGRLSLDIGRAISAGQEMRPFVAQVGYDPKAISLNRLRVGEATGLMLDGSGSFDRTESTGRLAMSATSASLTQITGIVAPLAPAVAARLNALPAISGAVRVKLGLDLAKASQADRASARAVLEIEAPQLKGVTTITATPAIAAVRGIDLEALSRSELAVDTRLAGPGRSLLALLGLDGVIAAGDAPVSLEASVAGLWRAPLRVKVKLSGAELDADAQGTAEPWGEPKAAITLAVRRSNLAPLFNLKLSDAVAQNLSLSSRVTLADNKLTFDDFDSTVAGSRLRGRAAVTLGGDKAVDAQASLDTIELGPAFGLAIGVRGHDAAEPLGRGLLQGWRGQLAFQAQRGLLPGGAEMRPVSGVVKSDGQSLSIDAIKGIIGGGELTADMDVKPALAGFAMNAHVQLSDVDGAALAYRSLTMPAGRASLRMTLSSQGRSASALQGALSGNGLLTIDAAQISGLDPKAFDVAIRASDSGQATNDTKLRQFVEPALSVGALSVASAQLPFMIKDGRLRVGATTLEAEGARAIVSGGYDIAADQADFRASLTVTATGSTSVRPEIQIFAAGSPDRLERSVDVAALSSWLAIRAIDRETQRLDSLERGETPTVVVPSPVALPPLQKTPDLLAPQPAVPFTTDVPVPRRAPAKPSVARPVAAPALAVPQVSEQVAPLPAPIEIRPAPGASRMTKPRLAPPLLLTPSAGTPARPAF